VVLGIRRGVSVRGRVVGGPGRASGLAPVGLARGGGRPRRDSAAARIISVLPAHPIASAATIRGAIGARHQRALEGLKVLADAGVLRQISAGTYDRQYAADELFELIETYEATEADRPR